MYSRYEKMTIAFVLVIILTSVGLNINSFLQQSKLQKKYDTQNMSKTDMINQIEQNNKQIDTLRTQNMSIKRIAGRFAHLLTLNEAFLKYIHDPSMQIKGKNTRIFDNSDLVDIPWNIHARGFDENYVKNLTQKFGDTRSYITFKYPETKESFDTFSRNIITMNKDKQKIIDSI